MGGVFAEMKKNVVTLANWLHMNERLGKFHVSLLTADKKKP